jgi:hypothetical protein
MAAYRSPRGKNKKVKRGRVSFIEETKRLSEVSC